MTHSKCRKVEPEKHLKEAYKDPKRGERFPYINKLHSTTAPGTAFEMSDIKAKEVHEFVKKSRSKSSPRNDGVSYKVYKKCPRLKRILLLLLQKIQKEKSVADRWKVAECIYFPRGKIA